MDKLYYWVGRIVVDGGLLFVGLVTMYFVFGFIGAFWGVALRKYRWLNYRYYFAIKLLKTFLLRKDWLRKGSPQEFEMWLRWHNNRAEPKAVRLRAEAPFYRWLYAYIVRHSRRRWAKSWA